MRIRLTRHAEERLKERGISLKEVKVCIQNPDYVEESRGAFRCWKRMGDKYVVVVYRVEHNQWIVITAYKTSRRPQTRGRH